MGFSTFNIRDITCDVAKWSHDVQQRFFLTRFLYSNPRPQKESRGNGSAPGTRRLTCSPATWWTREATSRCERDNAEHISSIRDTTRRLFENARRPKLSPAGRFPIPRASASRSRADEGSQGEKRCPSPPLLCKPEHVACRQPREAHHDTLRGIFPPARNTPRGRNFPGSRVPPTTFPSHPAVNDPGHPRTWYRRWISRRAELRNPK